MEILLCEIPYCCGEKDCAYQWHRTHFYADGPDYYQGDDSGDSDPIEADEVPDYDEQCKAWNEYYAYVAKTGLDPIDEIIVPKGEAKKHVWQVRVRNWIGATLHGVKATGLRRRSRGPWVEPKDAPECVRQYLLLTEKDCIPDFHSLEELSKADGVKRFKLPGKTAGIEAWVEIEIEEPAPEWPEERKAAHRKRVARKALRESKDFTRP